MNSRVKRVLLATAVVVRASFNIQQIAVIGALAMLSVFPVGCGLSLNPSAGSQSPGTSSPAAGASGGPSGAMVPFPGAHQALTGCTNPNTGVSNGDWGVGSNPVFVNIWDVVVGSPVYTSNAIFWTSRENAPGQSILLSGAFTGATKTVRIAPIPTGTSDWQTVVKSSTAVVPTIQEGTTGLSFIVPLSFPVGVYGFEIDDPSAPPIQGLANAPSLNWAVGTPSTIDPTEALQHQVYDCGVEPGGTLRLFGKNFTASNKVVLQSSSGTAYTLTPSKVDSNSLTALVPSTLAQGTYNVWVGNPTWDATSSPAGQLNVYLPPSRAVLNFSCPNMVGDGVTDNTKSLQSCLDKYAPVSSKEVAYITIPAGTFVLTAGVNGYPFEVLVGVSPAVSKFIGQPKGSPPAAWFNIPHYFGLVNLSLQGPANPNLLLSSGTTTGNPLTSGHLFFDNVSFASTVDASHGAESMFALAGPDIQVYNSYFLSNSNQVFDIIFGDGGIVSGNHIVLNNFTGLGISDSQNVIFEGNLTDSQKTPGPGNYGLSAGSGLSVSRGNSQYGQSALSRDIYIGYNTFQNMGSNPQQVITNDGDGGSYYGLVASSTADSVTLANDPAWNWMGTTNPEAAVITIVSGTGLGQYSLLKSYSGRTINLETPWKVVPDGTSVVVISQYELNMTIANNTITNTLGTSIVLGDALEGVIEDNVMTNSGAGILISAFGSYGGPAGYGPVMNTDVLRNTIAPGAGNYIWHSVNTNVAGIGIQDMPGCLESGLVIRDNVVSALEAIYNTDGLNGVNANLIEQNLAYWTPTFATSQFLVQDNSPPPD